METRLVYNNCVSKIISVNSFAENGDVKESSLSWGNKSSWNRILSLKTTKFVMLVYTSAFEFSSLIPDTAGVK